MVIASILEQFLQGILDTGMVEFIAVIAGIASVWFSRKAHILVYPIGLINTLLYIYLSFKGSLYGEASVNIYYSVMSIYGWIQWSKKDLQTNDLKLQIQFSNRKEWIEQLLFFSCCYAFIFSALTWLKQSFAPAAIPWADGFASASAFTGMWLMTRKKVESWIWWTATNIASIPLYFMKGYVFTSVQFMVLLVLSIAGLISWRKKVMYELC
ncbi:MAG: nicotinamide riboside transporter PnuC [Sphingobacteriia bacterium]|nr:MAG: nicotinamide riboside transporter PnuC [Sphingobacteriia bacterium]TAG29678.1 MAG: nicotinamide riboside transporter PnuC [Sphingobacteriia bacterium]TAH07574.1 MAG: nicotinamide riboside transporter PnuC [Sphingobacteriia bacterium]